MQLIFRRSSVFGLSTKCNQCLSDRPSVVQSFNSRLKHFVFPTRDKCEPIVMATSLHRTSVCSVRDRFPVQRLSTDRARPVWLAERGRRSTAAVYLGSLRRSRLPLCVLRRSVRFDKPIHPDRTVGRAAGLSTDQSDAFLREIFN